MNKADQKSQAIADNQARKDAEKHSVDLADILPFFRVDGLSMNQCKVLAACYLPGAGQMTKVQKAAIAGVDPKTWYNIIRTPKFQAALALKGRQIINVKAPVLLEVHMQDAIGEDRQSRRELLQQCGILDKQQSPGTPQQVVNVTILQQEREKKLERGMSRLGWDNKVVVND